MLARNEQKQQILQPNEPLATFSEVVLPITLCAPLTSFPESSASPLFRRLKATGYESGKVFLQFFYIECVRFVSC